MHTYFVIKKKKLPKFIDKITLNNELDGTVSDTIFFAITLVEFRLFGIK